MRYNRQLIKRYGWDKDDKAEIKDYERMLHELNDKTRLLVTAMVVKRLLIKLINEYKEHYGEPYGRR